MFYKTWCVYVLLVYKRIVMFRIKIGTFSDTETLAFCKLTEEGANRRRQNPIISQWDS